jgi:hypothetical protein
MKNHKMAITLSDDDFPKLEELREHKYCRRSKSGEIAWLISQEWERLQEEKREKTPAEIAAGIKAYVSRLEAKAASRRALQLKEKSADYIEPCVDPQIIQFPVRQIRQFSGSV